jgi:hypothetical protein
MLHERRQSGNLCVDALKHANPIRDGLMSVRTIGPKHTNGSASIPSDFGCPAAASSSSRFRAVIATFAPSSPQVKIDQAIPIPLWGLNGVGRKRTERLANAGRLSGTTQIISSGERKAIETAKIIGGELNVAVEVREAMHFGSPSDRACCARSSRSRANSPNPASDVGQRNRLPRWPRRQGDATTEVEAGALMCGTCEKN